MNLLDDLKKLGFAGNDACIYLTLYQYGPLTAPSLSKNLHMHRRNIYDCLEKLIARGVVRQIVTNKKRFFEANPSSRILELIKSQRKKLDEQEEIAKKIILNLSSLDVPSRFSRVFVYEGKEGLKAVFEDILTEGKDYVVFGSPGLAPQVFKWFIEEFTQKRIEKRMRLSIIYADDARERGKKMAELPLTKVRYMPAKYCAPSEAIVYANKTAIVQWAREFLAVVIESDEIARANRGFFKQLWKAASSKS